MMHNLLSLFDDNAMATVAETERHDGDTKMYQARVMTGLTTVTMMMMMKCRSQQQQLSSENYYPVRGCRVPGAGGGLVPGAEAATTHRNQSCHQHVLSGIIAGEYHQ